MRYTRKQLESLSSYEIETRIEQIQHDHLPRAAYEEVTLLQSVHYERVHHEAQIKAIKYAKAFAKAIMRRWHRRYALNERAVHE